MEENGGTRRRLSQSGPRPRTVSGVIHFSTRCIVIYVAYFFGGPQKDEVRLLLLIANGMRNMAPPKQRASGKWRKGKGKRKKGGKGNGTQFHNSRLGMRSIKLE